MADSTLDCSDIDQYLGKPMPPARMKEPLHNNDIRRWVQAMHYPNLLHYDHEFAAESRYGKLVAPQSFAVVSDDGQVTRRGGLLRAARAACRARRRSSSAGFGRSSSRSSIANE